MSALHFAMCLSSFLLMHLCVKFDVRPQETKMGTLPCPWSYSLSLSIDENAGSYDVAWSALGQEKCTYWLIDLLIISLTAVISYPSKATYLGSQHEGTVRHCLGAWVSSFTVATVGIRRWWMLGLPYISVFFIQPGPPAPGMALPTWGWAFPPQLAQCR